jgi:hypothetical protein
MRKLSVGGLFLLLCSIALVAQTLSPKVQPFVKVDSPVVALTHVRVIDGTGAAAREDQTIVVSHGKIEAVGETSATNIPKDAQVLDLHGYSVIPAWSGCTTTCFIRWATESSARWRSVFHACILPRA